MNDHLFSAKKKLPELLAPAGSIEKLKVAVHYGADAVYFGGPRHSLRAHAVLSEAEVGEAVAYAHEHGVRAYVTVNIIAHDRDFAGLDRYVRFLAGTGVDGLIVADPGIVALLRQDFPELPIHLSTQANVTNSHSARFWDAQGVRRINLARELSLEEMRSVREAVGCEIEVFVHGALCISYSGRCLLSCYLTGRSANEGDCAHPCRYSYRLVEEKRPGHYLPVEEDNRGTYIFNSRDLCLLRRLPDLLALGVHAFKIEGRMKGTAYVGGVVRAYRATLDWLGQELERLGPERIGAAIIPGQFLEEIARFAGRGYTENFLDSPPGGCDMLYHNSRVPGEDIPVGIVRKGGEQPMVAIKNPIRTGQIVEHLGPRIPSAHHLVKNIIDHNGSLCTEAHPGEIVTLETSPPCRSWREHEILRSNKVL